MTDFTQARTAMVDCQIRPSDVTSFPIIDAMLRTPRERYVPASLQEVAYAEAALKIAPGRELLPPRTLAKLLDAARLGPDDLVLDIAPGQGYSTALIARLCAAVIAVEPDKALAELAEKTLSGEELENAVVIQGEPAKGDAGHGPYDAILINGAVSSAPEGLTSQLREGGRIVAIEARRAGGVATVWIRSGDVLQGRPLFAAEAPVIAGFEAEDVFAF